MAEILVRRLNAEPMIALVDDEDLALVEPYRWHPETKPGFTAYAQTTYRTPDGKRHSALMHVLIMGKPFVDHINGNGLDNRRSNLRFASASQNQMNTASRTGNSRYKGVCFDVRNKRWKAYITANGKRISLGMHSDERSAALAYDAAAVVHHGEFARLNFATEAPE